LKSIRNAATQKQALIPAAQPSNRTVRNNGQKELEIMSYGFKFFPSSGNCTKNLQKPFKTINFCINHIKFGGLMPKYIIRPGMEG
jgi:hypothetical protein